MAFPLHRHESGSRREPNGVSGKHSGARRSRLRDGLVDSEIEKIERHCASGKAVSRKRRTRMKAQADRIESSAASSSGSKKPWK